MHSHIEHLRALLELARREGMAERTWIHAFTDGRDVSPASAVDDLAELPADRIATVCGRYYAMDRDKRWDRTALAAGAILDGAGREEASAVAAVRESHERGVTDEFIEPVVISGRPRLRPGVDTAVFFNFRPDRAPAALTTARRGRRRPDDDDELLERRSTFLSRFGEQEVRDTLAEVLSRHGVRQLHTAETEKYAHVTYFFNGGEEAEWEGESGYWSPHRGTSPATTSSRRCLRGAVTERFCEEIGKGYGFAVINFANPDMVGHTGSIPAVITAVETTDTCLGRVVAATPAAGGVCLVTADHGNAEQMLESNGVDPFTAHTTNPVPLVLTDPAHSLRDGGELSDLAPTVLDLLGITQPAAMTGRSLLAGPAG